MLPEVTVEMENGEPLSIRTIRWDNIEKIFGAEIAHKIRDRLRRG